MFSTSTKAILLLGAFALVHTPASAKPLRHAGKAIQKPHAVFTDVSATRRYRHVARHQVQRVRYARSARVRHIEAPVFDRFAVGDQYSMVSPSYPVGGSLFGGFSAEQPRSRSARVRVPYETMARAHRPDQFATSSPTSPVGGSLFSGGLVAEARRYVGTNPTGRGSLWCGHFMNMVLTRSGYRASSSNMARSFASYGRRISGPQIGAIAVMSRGPRGGHVGVVSGIDANGNPIIISGNHNRRVAETVYPRGRIYTYVMP